MFNRRKDDEYTPKPTSLPAPRTDTPREGLSSMSTAPIRTHEPESSRGGAAMIGKSVVLKGQVISREDLYVDGEVEGNIELQDHRLTIGPNGKVHAGIKAREIVVLGSVHGNVEAADKIEIRKDSKLIGDIKTARIMIEDGAYFKGSIDITKPEVKKQPEPKKESAPAVVPTPLVASAPEPKR
jgi:cytoskeletal protein CcmA (bactofilin family)